MGLDFSKLTEANIKRKEILHNRIKENKHWSMNDWATAISGEFGELAESLLTFFSKLKVFDKFKKIHREDISLEKSKDDIGKEFADIVIYADLLCSEMGINLEEYIQSKFNEVSDRHNIDIKI